MRSSHRTHGPRLLAVAIALASCRSSDASIGCSPTLTCSLRDARFEPQDDERDAGPVPCARSREGCRAKQIATGGKHSCAITEAGEVACWGDDARGQLGVDAMPDASAPGVRPVDGADEPDAGLVQLMAPARQITAGGEHTCVIAESGKLYGWGDNRAGQIDGHPSPDPVPDPVVIPIDDATEIAAGALHTCAIIGDAVRCWGSSRFGQAGRQIGEEPLEMGEVPGTDGAVQLAAGVRHTCARMKNAHVLCWGELIDPDTGAIRGSAEPIEVPGLDDATAIAAGAGHTCALRRDGTVVCWGENSSGQLGDGSTRSSAVPVMVQGLELSLRVSAGGIDDDGTLVGHSCALTKGFFVQCWGRNREGQLGVGREGDSAIAKVVLAPSDDDDDETYLTDTIAVAAGGLHTCAIDDNGRPIHCWGDNTRDQLGAASDEPLEFGRPSEVRRFGGMRFGRNR